jgi:hypothetical protein
VKGRKIRDLVDRQGLPLRAIHLQDRDGVALARQNPQQLSLAGTPTGGQRIQRPSIARKIAGPVSEAETLELARRIGEAQVDLNRDAAGWRARR